MLSAIGVMRRQRRHGSAGNRWIFFRFLLFLSQDRWVRIEMESERNVVSLGMGKRQGDLFQLLKSGN